MAPPVRKYDVAISFASEDREVAETLAAAVRAAGLTVFYDKYEEADLWGKNLYEHLTIVYQDQARFCAMLISEHYSKKQWTSHERRAAQARAITENQEYILPIRLDDSDVPGVLRTVAHLDLREKTVAEVAELLIKKIQARDGQYASDLVNEELAGDQLRLLGGTPAELLTFLVRTCPDGLGRKSYNLAALCDALPDQSEDALHDAVHELEGYGFVDVERALGNSWWLRLSPESYERLDNQLMDWSPEDDAKTIAELMLSTKNGQARKLLDELGWSKRRFNPAQRLLTDIVPAGLVSRELQPNFATSEIAMTPEVERKLRRFASRN